MKVTDPLDARASALYRATVTLENESTPIMDMSVVIATMTLTLRDVVTREIINGRDAQNVKNANGVTLYDLMQTDADGVSYNLKWEISVGDTTPVGAGTRYHDGEFVWTWGSAPVKTARHRVRLIINPPA